MATAENVGQHPASSPNSVHILRRRFAARQMDRTNGQVTPTQPDAAGETDRGVVPYPLVARLEALETRVLLARIEGLEARAAEAPGTAGNRRAPGTSPSELRIADSFRNRSHDEASQLRMQVASLEKQVAEFQEHTKGVRHRGRRRKSSRRGFWPGRGR